jgi:Clp amino terminal domain, pathogenicity island component
VFERFTRNARLVVTHAVDEAESRGDTRIGTEHLLIGVARSRSLEGLMPDVEFLRAELQRMDREALASVGLDPGLVEVSGPTRRKRSGHIPFTSGAKDILKGALREALDLGHRHISVEHIALALTAVEGPDRAMGILHGLDLDPDALRAALLRQARQAS